MKRSRLGLAGLLSLVVAGGILVPATAGAKKKAAPSPCTSAYVDMDNDGACTPGDLPLVPILHKQHYFDTDTAVPGMYTPPGHGVGIVFENYRGRRDLGYDIRATGNLWLRGKNEFPHNLYTRILGDINIPSGSSVFTNYYLDLNNSWYWEPARSLNIGNDVTIGVSRKWGTFLMYAHEVNIGERFTFSGARMVRDPA